MGIILATVDCKYWYIQPNIAYSIPNIGLLQGGADSQATNDWIRSRYIELVFFFFGGELWSTTNSYLLYIKSGYIWMKDRILLSLLRMPSASSGARGDANRARRAAGHDAGGQKCPQQKRPMWWVNQFLIFQFVKHGSSWILDAQVSSGFGAILMILNLKSKMVDHHFALKALRILGHRGGFAWSQVWSSGPRYMRTLKKLGIRDHQAVKSLDQR